MRKLELNKRKASCRAIQQEILRSEESRYDHRLHGVLMVGNGMNCVEVARWLGQDGRTVERWVKRFNAGGLVALREGDHPGRPRLLTATQWAEMELAVRMPPRERGYPQNLWDGKLLAHHLASTYGVELSVRQCQRIFRRMGFRLREPRPVIAEGDPQAQAAYKRTRSFDTLGHNGPLERG